MAFGLRMRLASLLERSGMLGVAIRAQRIVPLPWLPIVGYHRIGEPSVVARETDEGVVDATAEDFERHVAFLARSFDVVGIDTLRRYFVEDAPLPKNPALITFDDGYRECFDVAFPILQRYGVPGVFFVSTDHVTRRRVFWWDRIAYLFKRCARRTTVSIDYPAPLAFDLSSGRAVGDALAVVKTTRDLDLERYLAALTRALDVPWTENEEERISGETLVTWDHLREMQRGGMDVQSHTATHRVLQTLSDEALERELVDSKRTLEAELGVPISAIAYPNGFAVGRGTRIGRAVHAAGYDLGFSGGGVCRRSTSTDPLDIRRVSVDVHIPDAYFRACVMVPPLGAL